MKSDRNFLTSLFDPEFVPTALKVALVVGSLLFTINHSAALLKKQMTRDRWIAGILTYVVPYVVNIHGQFTSRSRRS
jgi:hypothetical protein